MIKTGAKIVQNTFSAANINKQMDFGTAVGLTRTAKRGQEAVLGALRGIFTLRGTWFEQKNKYGIKVTPATKTSQKAEIYTLADWLVPHEEGKDKSSIAGHSVAVPTDQVRRNKRFIIPRGQRPKGLGGKAFVLETKHGKVLAQRITRGKRKGLIILYGLEPRVHIKKQSTFYEPARKQVQRFLKHDVAEGIAYAWRTAR